MRSRVFAWGLAGAVLIATASIAPRAHADDAHADEAHADARSLIVIVCAPGDRFGLRVLAELEALGFRAVIRDAATGAASRASLEAFARDAGAIAAIRAVPSEHGVEVWIADRVTGKTVLREMENGPGAQDPDAALALQVVELLRASLLEAALPPPPRGRARATRKIRDEMDIAVPDPPAPPATWPTLRLWAGAGALLSPGGLSVAPALDVGVAWTPSEHVGVMGFSSFSLRPASVTSGLGIANLSVVLGGGGIRFLFLSRESRWAPSLDLGVTAVVLKSSATDFDGNDAGRPVSAVTASPIVRLGTAFAATPHVRIRVDVLGGGIAGEVSLQHAGTEIAAWGKPFALLSGGLDLGLF